MSLKKRFLLIAMFAVVAAMVLTPGVAFANYSVHGSYTMSTDACAGCHRAHTAASSITWTKTDGSTGGSALLLGTASTIDAFCYTCHGTAMLGADTNVFDGVYEADDGVAADDTLNSFGQDLNGGGFDPAMFPTQHYPNNTTWVAYGGGTTGRDSTGLIITGGEQVVIGCSVCHDTHGSSNYRLLKDVVNGVTVGGYTDSGDPLNPTPNPWVISAEPGYPTGGWLLHEMGNVQVATYTPDYTNPRYAKAPGLLQSKGISGWCASCHTQYNTWTSANTSMTSSVYDSNDGFGPVTRHRHPVNVPLSNYLGARALIVTTTVLPLAHGGSADYEVKSSSDWIDCLTCHVGHGSSVLMTGYAAVADSTDPLPDSSYGVTPGDGLGSVAPDDGNALLRSNNRGVCEACHNK